MTNTRVRSNRRVTVWMGPAIGILDYLAPTKAEVDAMLNVSGAIKWDGFDFNLQASDQEDDRSLTDEAGAQDRSFDQFGGNIAFFAPRPDDTGSIFRQAKDLVGGPSVELAVVIRVVKLNSLGIATGDEVNAYRVITDAEQQKRGSSKRFYTINFRPRDSVGVGCIIPSTVPTAVAVSPAGPLSIVVGKVAFLKSTYEGRNVTVGARYVSDNPAVAPVTNHGIAYGAKAGTANVSVTYPGSAPGTPIVVTVTAA